MSNNNWGINIDIEGFSNFYQHDEEMQTYAISGLKHLMDAVISVGKKVYPGDPNKNESDRIFAHQFGDGFILTSNFDATNPNRPIAIAVSLSRHMLLQGFATKAAISAGDMANINGCYPKEVKSAKNNTLRLGAGLMTTIPVMGTALTKANKLGNRVSGNVVVVDKSAFSNTPNELIKYHDEFIGYINWMSDGNELSREISEKEDLLFGNERQLHEEFSNYIKLEPCPPEKWIEGSKKCQNKFP